MANLLWNLFYIVLVLDILFIISVSIIFIYCLFASHFMRSSPPIPTVGCVKRGILKETEGYIRNIPHAKVVDLGSGWGSMLLPLAQKYPQHSFIGYEYLWLPYIVSRWRTHKLPNIKIYRKDFFTIDFTNVDAILCFQLPSVMKKLLPYLRRHVNQTVRILVNRYPFEENIKPLKKVLIEGNYAVYYVYDIKKE